MTKDEMKREVVRMYCAGITFEQIAERFKVDVKVIEKLYDEAANDID